MYGFNTARPCPRRREQLCVNRRLCFSCSAYSLTTPQPGDDDVDDGFIEGYWKNGKLEKVRGVGYYTILTKADSFLRAADGAESQGVLHQARPVNRRQEGGPSPHGAGETPRTSPVHIALTRLVSQAHFDAGGGSSAKKPKM